MTMLDKRNQILQSLRTQFSTKIARVLRFTPDDDPQRAVYSLNADQLDAFLIDLANNIAQGLDEDDEEEPPLDWAPHAWRALSN